MERRGEKYSHAVLFGGLLIVIAPPVVKRLWFTPPQLGQHWPQLSSDRAWQLPAGTLSIQVVDALSRVLTGPGGPGSAHWPEELAHLYSCIT